MASLVYYKNKKNGVTYVYENSSTWNKETQRCDTKRKCIGKLDPESGEVIPTGKRGRGGGQPKTTIYASVRCEGISLLLDKIADDLSLSSILKETLPSEWDRILTCAYCLISEGKPLSHVETWSAQNTHPYGKAIPSQRVSELIRALTRDKQLAFFARWIETRAESEYMALDITSVSSYSKQNEYVRYGYNRDKENLPQINLCLLLGQDSGIPVYYESLNGSIKDVSALENVFEMMGWLKARKLHAVMDRGFYSERNIDGLYDKRIKFVVGVPFTPKWALELVDKTRNHIENYEYFHSLGSYTFFADTDTTTWKGHRCYRHVYYDSQKAATEHIDFLEKIDLWRLELLEGQPVEKHQQYYDKYFDVKETPKRGRRVLVREEEIQNFKEKTAGFFILISNDIKDPVQALKVYRDKDAVEKGFDNLKNALDMKRLRVHSAQTMQGRLFLQFVAQILVAAIRNVMVLSRLDERFTLPELMNELKSLHSVRLDGNKKPISTKLSKTQREILDAFGIRYGSYV